MFILLTTFTRIYSERLVGSVFYTGNFKAFIITIILLSAFVLRSGIEVIARMNEIIFAFMVTNFAFVALMIFSSVKLYNLTPVSYLDVIPVGKASLGSFSVMLLAIVIYFFSDKIRGIEKTLKMGFKATLFHFFALTVLIIQTVGTLGYNIIKNSLFPYLQAVETVSLFATFERIESIIVVTWILSDFIIITVLMYTIFNSLKSVILVTEEKLITPLFYGILYFSSILIAKNSVEIANFWDVVIIPGMIIFGFGIPCLVLGIGKIRKVL